MWEGARELVQNWHDGLVEHAELASSIVWGLRAVLGQVGPGKARATASELVRNWHDGLVEHAELASSIV